ncbi:hypothetical protein [Achromobacter insuavis]|uniref:Uncharacterized protein n=1 Tax=Achromobacter insuavis AXX-A TaxID=1003200 RepID=F7T9I9_9BURK|nr:hypothetical protein [Achromobacter insuavis]EGP42994.1 hypothetical protein AXXA_28135 [Achromobacter insuavis AXX-A]
MDVAALFVETDGAYFGVPGVDPWDEPRDARKYAGYRPVVAHPPCQRWGRYWHGPPNKPHQFRLGEDGGCFGAALTAVRNYGGVLEHPADSHAWGWFGLKKPPRAGRWVRADEFGGWTCYVEQGHYGHMARKGTWLYAVGTALPELKWGRSPQRIHPRALELHGYEKARRIGMMAMVGGQGQDPHPRRHAGRISRRVAGYRPQRRYTDQQGTVLMTQQDDIIPPVLTDADIEEIRQDWHCFFQSSTQGGVGVCIRDIERRVLSQVRTPVPDERQLLVALQAIAEHPDSGEWNLGAAKLREIARAALASAPLANDVTPAGMKEICPECGHQFGCFHSPYIDKLRAQASAPVAGEAITDLQALQWAEKYGIQWALHTPDAIREVIADAQRLAAPQASAEDDRELRAAAQAFYDASKTVARFAVESLDDRDALVAASVRLRAALSATQPEQGFTECVFDGPAPEGYKSWHAWCTTPVKSGAFIRAARVDDWAKNPTGEDTKP